MMNEEKMTNVQKHVGEREGFRLIQCSDPQDTAEVWWEVHYHQSVREQSATDEEIALWHCVSDLLGAAVSASPQPRPWFPIETAPKNGRHIQAADFTPGATGFGGNPKQSFQCVVHWWEWCDGTHQEEWGWYPSTGAGESNALTNLTHWRPLDAFFAAAPAQEPRCEHCDAGIPLGKETTSGHFRDGEFVGWCKKSEIYREAAAQEQPVENSPQEEK